MRNQIKIYSVLLFVFLFSSCNSVYYGSSLSSSKQISGCLYINGYWGDWNNWNALKAYQGRATINSLESITLYSSNHPSDIDFEIVPEKYLGKEKDWYRYTGIVNVSCFREYYDGLGEHYQNKTDLSNCTDNKTRFTCEILSSHLINYVVEKKGTINVFYNGVGRGYSFKNY